MTETERQQLTPVEIEFFEWYENCYLRARQQNNLFEAFDIAEDTEK